MGRRARVGSARAGSVSPRRHQLRRRAAPELHRGQGVYGGGCLRLSGGAVGLQRDVPAVLHQRDLHRGQDLQRVRRLRLPRQPNRLRGGVCDRQLLLRSRGWWVWSVLPLPHQRRRRHLPVWDCCTHADCGGIKPATCVSSTLCLHCGGCYLTKSRPAPGRAEWPSGEQRRHLLSHPLVEVAGADCSLLTQQRGRRGVGDLEPPGLKVASAGSGVSANVIARYLSAHRNA